MFKRIFFSILFLMGCCFLSSAEEKFPFLAEVNAPGINVRAGQNANFESLCRLKRGSEVIVVGKSYNWYKIRLPAEAKSYVSQDFIQMLGPDKAVILRDRVNIRAGAGMKFSVLGQLDKGALVKVLEKLEGWCRIEPGEGLYGWVGLEFLTFKSDRVPLPQKVQTTLIEGSAAANSFVPSSEATGPRSSTAPELPRPAAPFAIGRLENLPGPFPAEDIRFRLINGEGMIYYLKGEKWIFEEFAGAQVKVEGKFLDNAPPIYSHPVLVVQSISLVL